MQDQIILASSSPRRRELLSKIGMDFTVDAADIDENLKIEAPALLVEALSKEKAGAVSAKHPNCVIIGADTVVTVDTVDTDVSAVDAEGAGAALSGAPAEQKNAGGAALILGKPKDAADAVRMLSLLSGRTHRVLTGVTLLKTGGSGELIKECTFHEVTEVTFFPLSEAEIAAYVSTGEPLDKAGAYGIQERGLLLVKEIRGDYCNVVGLPVARLFRKLRQF